MKIADDTDDLTNYPTELLNSLKPPGFPPHELNLKVGSSIIILRNIEPHKLCNRTRLVVKKMYNNLIEVTIICVKFKGSHVFILLFCSRTIIRSMFKSNK